MSDNSDTDSERLPKDAETPESTNQSVIEIRIKEEAAESISDTEESTADIDPYEEVACVKCAKCFERKNMANHLLLHDINAKPYKCDLCDKSFARNGHLTVHRAGVHKSALMLDENPGEKQNTTNGNHTDETDADNDLADGNSTSVDIQPTAAVVDAKPSKETTCKLCGKLVRNMKRHLKSHIECDVCGKQFNRIRHYRQHQIMHTGIKYYHCDLCDKSFGRHDTLAKHRRTHSGERLFNCEVCAKYFSRRDHLAQHWLSKGHLRKAQPEQQQQPTKMKSSKGKPKVRRRSTSALATQLQTSKSGDDEDVNSLLVPLPKKMKGNSSKGKSKVMRRSTSLATQRRTNTSGNDDESLLVPLPTKIKVDSSESKSKLLRGSASLATQPRTNKSDEDEDVDDDDEDVDPLLVPQPNEIKGGTSKVMRRSTALATQPWTNKSDDEDVDPLLVPQMTDEGKFLCNLCDKAFLRQSNLSRHLLTRSHLRKAGPIDVDVDVEITIDE